MELRNGDESWIPVGDAAARLGVEEAAIHRRHPHFLETRRLGDHVCVRAADVDEWAKDGLPYEEWEAVREGLIVPMPDNWAVVDHPRASHGPAALIGLRPVTLATRELQPGDVLAADEPLPHAHQIAGQDTAVTFAELPLRFGVLGYLRALEEKVARLEAELAEAKA